MTRHPRKGRSGALLRLFASAAVCGLLAAPVVVQAQTLTDIQLVSKGESAGAVVMEFSGQAPRPAIFSVTSPAQLTIDLLGVENVLESAARSRQNGLVQSVDIATVADGTRVVLTLARSVPYHVERYGDRLKLVLNSAPGDVNYRGGLAVTRLDLGDAPQRAAMSVTSAPGATSTRGASERAMSERRVTNINFRRGPNDGGIVVVELSRGNAPVNIKRTDGTVVARIGDTNLPERFEKLLDVTEFGSLVTDIKVQRKNGDVRLAINTRQGANFTQLAYATGGKVVIELKPPQGTGQDGKTADKPKFTGEKITLSFQDVKVRKLLQIIGSVADINLVVTGKVDGAMSLRLESVPWDQALNIILRAQNLGKRRSGNVITIAPLGVLTARAKSRRAARQATRSLSPLTTEIITLNYADAGDMAKLVKFEGSGKGVPGGLLSSRGVIRVDQRTNSLIVTATRNNIDRIQRLINKLDKPKRQVLIQSRIVIANDNFQRQLGVEFDLLAGDAEPVTGPGGNAGGNQGGFNVGLPIASTAGSIFASIITSNLNIGLALQALQTQNQGKIVSAPRVITLDGQSAVISRGQEIPYVSSTGGALGGTTVEFKEAELSLEVTPRITPDGSVALDISIQKDSIGQTVPTAGGGSAPSIDTNELETTVLVDNGDTLVLGGIYQRINTRDVTSVPYLSDVPIVGNLFESTDRTDQRNQLLIFITPRILDSRLGEAAVN